MKPRTIPAFLTGVLFTFGIMILLGAGGTVKSPTGTAPNRYAYYPGTEELAKDEIRLIACGTGLPAARRDSSRNETAARLLAPHRISAANACRMGVCLSRRDA